MFVRTITGVNTIKRLKCHIRGKRHRASHKQHFIHKFACRSLISFVLIVDECRRVVDEMAFGVWDYVVFVTTLLISASIGVYVRFSGGRQKTAEVRKIRLIVLGKPGVENK